MRKAALMVDQKRILKGIIGKRIGYVIDSLTVVAGRLSWTLSVRLPERVILRRVLRLRGWWRIRILGGSEG